jgi:hypothetical protein
MPKNTKEMTYALNHCRRVSNRGSSSNYQSSGYPFSMKFKRMQFECSIPIVTQVLHNVH